MFYFILLASCFNDSRKNIYLLVRDCVLRSLLVGNFLALFALPICEVANSRFSTEGVKNMP